MTPHHFMYYVYLLKSKKDNKLYIGLTNDLKKRLIEHNQGLNKSTKYRRPLVLIYYEAYSSLEDAQIRERKLKKFKNSYTELKKRIINSLRENKSGGGFTLIEILVVISLISIFAFFFVSVGLNFYKSQQLESQSQTILQTLRRAQLKAMSVELDSSFGVYLTNDSYVLFKGSSYVARDPQYDEVFELPKIINVSGISEIVFSKFEGKPSVIGNIILATNSQQKIININEIGRINLK